MNRFDVTKKAEYLIEYFSLRWLANKIGRSVPTIHRRLESQEWRLKECIVIEELYDVATFMESRANEKVEP